MSNEKVFPELSRANTPKLLAGPNNQLYLEINGTLYSVSAIANDEVHVELTEFGIESDSGNSPAFSRADHNHGTPNKPEIPKDIFNATEDIIENAEVALVRKPGTTLEDEDAWGLGALNLENSVIVLGAVSDLSGSLKFNYGIDEFDRPTYTDVGTEDTPAILLLLNSSRFIARESSW